MTRKYNKSSRILKIKLKTLERRLNKLANFVNDSSEDLINNNKFEKLCDKYLSAYDEACEFELDISHIENEYKALIDLVDKHDTEIIDSILKEYEDKKYEKMRIRNALRYRVRLREFHTNETFPHTVRHHGDY